APSSRLSGPTEKGVAPVVLKIQDSLAAGKETENPASGGVPRGCTFGWSANPALSVGQRSSRNAICVLGAPEETSTMPKLGLSFTGDQYWSSDSTPFLSLAHHLGPVSG